MSSFHKRNAFSNNSHQSGQGNRFSTIKRQKSIDLSDPNLFPNLDGTINEPHANDVKEDSTPSTNSTEECECSSPVPDKETKDIVPPGWIVMTLADAREPKRKPAPEPEPEYETDDENTMLMPISKKPLKHRWSDPEPNVDLTTAQILYQFQLAVARHDRKVSATEDDDDSCEDYIFEDEYTWRRDTDLDFSEDDDYMDEEDDEDYYEYE